jgi:hypothetical protein
LAPLEGGDVFRNLRTLYDGIKRNFSFVLDVRRFIAGKAAYYDEFRDIFAAGVCGARGFHEYWRGHPNLLKAAEGSAVLREIELASDGVLDREWARGAMGLGSGARLMEVDVEEARARLMAGGQAREAVVARRFPDTRVGRLSERLPVAKLRARLVEGGAPRVLMVARDGVVYADLSESAALAPLEGGEVFRNLRTLYDGIKRNFSFVLDVRLFIAGKAAYYDEFRDIFAAESEK